MSIDFSVKGKNVLITGGTGALDQEYSPIVFNQIVNPHLTDESYGVRAGWLW